MEEPKNHQHEAFYQGRWIKKSFFRVFVYNRAGEKCLADGHDEYVRLLTSGDWFETPEEASGSEIPAKVIKNDPVSDTQSEKPKKAAQNRGYVRRLDAGRNPNS